MKKLVLKALSLVLCLLLSNSLLLAQQTANGSADEQYNSGPVLSAQDKIDAVYGATFFDGKEGLEAEFVRLLEERIDYKYLVQRPDEKFPSIRSNGYLDKINPYPGDQGFDENSFNPLWFNLDFFAKTKKVYRIDNSDYVLIIEPQ